MDLAGKRVIVTGGAHGLGRSMVEALVRAGARVTAVGRDTNRLGALERETEGRVGVRAGDVRDPAFARRVLEELRPDGLVLNAGVQPHLAPVHEHTWETFSAPWETDVRQTFEWCSLAVRLPLAPGAAVLIMSSGAAVGGSPMSGGYAGAKRTQWIVADYFQRESTARKLGVRFHAVLPRSIVAASEMGSHAVDTYAKSAGLSREKYLERFGTVVTPAGVGRGVVEVLETDAESVAYVLLENRVQPVGLALSGPELFAMK